MPEIVDWDLAATTAARLAPPGPSVTFSEAAGVVSELRRLSEEAAEHVAGFTDLPPAVDPAPVQVVDRGDWAKVNISGLRKVIKPVSDKMTAVQANPVLRTVAPKVTGAQAGGVLAYMSSKVLGQYEVFSGGAGRLLLVAPNIVEVERKLGADPRDFRMWVCLHEVTHRTQFTAVPWMREHFFSEVNAFIDASELDPEAIADRVRRAFTTVSDLVNDPQSRANLLEIVQTPAQKAVLDRLTALMTLVEGHAEYVMDGVGPDVVPSVAEIRAAFNARRASANPVEKLVRRLLGVEAKLRQYAEGRQFVAAIVDEVGMAGFNRIWTSPNTLPVLAELTNPKAWIERVHGRPATTAE
ncbi:zinc-dependent metalloprotease [Fodinicola acaciae]|uniref:zinc-dependent metalloprotease n=1 Tax=Fodinicola acaciae TaxID=2681555 RepID=UPI0013D7C145|nr:zinc-dependent metalloprotease [Fodinicola acaciae]